MDGSDVGPRQQYGSQDDAQYYDEVQTANSSSSEPQHHKPPKQQVGNPPLPKAPRRRSLIDRIFNGGNNEEGERRSSVGSMNSYGSSRSNSSGSAFSGVRNALRDSLSKNNESIMNRANADSKARRKKRGDKGNNMHDNAVLMAHVAQMQKEFNKQMKAMESKVIQREEAIKTLERALSIQTKSLEQLKTENNKLTAELKIERERNLSDAAEKKQNMTFSFGRRNERKKLQLSGSLRDEDLQSQDYKKGQRLRLDYHNSMSNSTNRIEKILQSDNYGRGGYRQETCFNDDTEQTSLASSNTGEYTQPHHERRGLHRLSTGSSNGDSRGHSPSPPISIQNRNSKSSRNSHNNSGRSSHYGVHSDPTHHQHTAFEPYPGGRVSSGKSERGHRYY
mmetsp:Transcript_20133/g.30277  ORF Transcript_20133/g.30277 Transcript_20133/m.30277 type:complete len:392 (+) Transcript_20133:84-1259(+)